MLSKQSFCMALRMINEQREIDEEFSKALEKMGNGFLAFGCDNKYYIALLAVLKEAVNDQYDYIDWWLYDTSDYIVAMQDGTREWNLKEPEDLYDYIVNECQDEQTKEVENP